MPLFVIIIFISLIQTKSFAFLDFIGEQAKKAAEAAAYADAVSELAGEISPNEELKAGAEDINKRAELLRSRASEMTYLSRTTQETLKGPDWSSKRLETNIRSTTDYVRKLKRLIARIAILGTDGAVALNTTETNVSLNEVQKNQQALLLQNEDQKLRSIEKEEEERREWQEFASNQKHFRQNGDANGKLR
jgi:hypothetical protein